MPIYIFFTLIDHKRFEVINAHALGSFLIINNTLEQSLIFSLFIVSPLPFKTFRVDIFLNDVRERLFFSILKRNRSFVSKKAHFHEYYEI